MSQKPTGSIALFFALGNQLHDCRMVDSDSVPAVGSTIELKERNLHTRSSEHCTRPCCAKEPTAQFRVLALSGFAGGWQGLSQVAEAREWEESACRRHEWCSLFDSYTLAGYLGLELDSESAPHAVVVVEVEKV